MAGIQVFEAQFLSGEEPVRSGGVLLQIAYEPWWWHGTMILTTTRLIFVPDVPHPRAEAPALALSDVGVVRDAGGGRFLIMLDGHRITFAPAGRQRRSAEAWIDAIRLARRRARQPMRLGGGFDAALAPAQ